MLKSLYEAIRKDAPAQEIKLNGRTYTTGSIFKVGRPLPDPLRVKTLTAIVDYLKSNVDSLGFSNLICHIESPASVKIYSGLLGDFNERDLYIEANLEQLQLKFNTYLSGETFNVLLQSCFLDYPDDVTKATDRGLVLAYCSSVREVAEGVTLDDGVTQAVTVKKGIAAVENVTLPNPVTLRPYRTFTEVEQPASQFVFRAAEGPEFMLVEADGGAWKSEAMQNIKKFMEFEVPGLAVIA